jgi:hypothetical protein
MQACDGDAEHTVWDALVRMMLGIEKGEEQARQGVGGRCYHVGRHLDMLIQEVVGRTVTRRPPVYHNRVYVACENLGLRPFYRHENSRDPHDLDE